MVEVDEIKQLDFFSVFSQEQLEELSKITEKRIYEKGALVYQRGYVANHIYIVTKGLVGLNRLEPGDKIGISFEKREQGELFGAACFMEPKEYTLTAVCMADSEVMVLDADNLFEICERDPELGYKFLKEIAQIYFGRYKSAKRNLHEMVRTPTLITALPG